MFDRRSGSASAFRWRVEVGDSALLSTLAYALPAAVGGVALLAAVLFGSVVLAAARGGEFGRAVGVVALLAVALLAQRWFLPAVAEADVVESLSGRYSRRGVALASVVGAAALYASLLVHPVAPFVLFVASWVPFALVARFPTEGCADPDEGVLVVDGDRVPLEAVRSYRAFPFGRFALCWVSYARGVSRAPRTLVVTGESLDRVRSLLDGGATRERDAGDASGTGAAQRRILTAFGVAFVAVGPALWVLLPSEGAVLAFYAGALFGAFGAVFLWYAATA